MLYPFMKKKAFQKLYREIVGRYSSKKNKKDAKWASDNHLSKFDRFVVVNLKTISYLFGVYITWFLI